MKKKIKIGKIFGLIFAVLFVAILVFPFYWQLISSFKDPEDLMMMPTEIWPSRFSLDFFKNVFSVHHFDTFLKNSIIVSGFSMLFSILVALPAAYAFTRIRFSGYKFWKNFMLLANMFPIIAVVTPLFVVFKKLHLVHTYAGLIIPTIVITLPLSIWTLVAFLGQIPYDLEQAAQIDGCTRLQAVCKVILPLMTPGLFSTAIIAFITAWNELMFSLVFVTKNEWRTVPVGITLFVGEFTVPWGDMAAASICATVPIVIVVLICQKQIVAGLTAGAVKG